MKSNGLAKQMSVHEVKSKIQYDGLSSQARNWPISEQLQSAHAESSADYSTITLNSIWRDVARQINVRKAKAKDIEQLSSYLHRQDMISYEEYVHLNSAMHDYAIHSQQDYYVDYIELWNKRLESAIRYGAGRSEIEMIHRIQTILQDIHNLR